MDTRRWGVKLMGQPPSINHMYEPAWEPVRDRFGMPVYKGNGQAAMKMRMVKASFVSTYQDGVILQVRTARPSGWIGASRIRIRYEFNMARSIDCDNAMKALNDAIAKAIGVDDQHFLPCVVSKVTGCEEPFVRIEIENEP